MDFQRINPPAVFEHPSFSRIITVSGSAKIVWFSGQTPQNPDLSCVAETPFGAEIAAEGASGLQPVFETDIRRTVRSLRLAGETVAQAAIDVGRVFAGEATQDVNELELDRS